MTWDEIRTIPSKQLTELLFDAGLAPDGIECLPCRDGKFFYHPPPRGALWTPWQKWDDCVYLIERLGCTVLIDSAKAEYLVEMSGISRKAASIKHIPEVVCRMALWLR
jgi:hypothetical protein